MGADYSVVTKPEPHLYLNRKDAGEAKSEYGKSSFIAAKLLMKILLRRLKLGVRPIKGLVTPPPPLEICAKFPDWLM